MNQKIIDHLSSRPFAPILRHELSKGENTIALKLMCIIDYLLEIKRLYPDIQSQPKFLEQLLCFNDLERFHYYEYKLPDFPFVEWMLVCQCCEFVAPYKYTLEHMVLSHNRHLSAELCHWCGKHELRDHTQFDTLSQCFHNYYYNKMGSYAGSQNVNALIKNVFAQFRWLASKLGVKTHRNSSYRASKAVVREMLATGGNDDDDIAKDVFVTKTQIRSSKIIKLDQLDVLFQKAMDFFQIDVRGVQHLPFDQQSTSDTCSTHESFAIGRNKPTVPMMQSTPHASNAQQMPQNPDVLLFATTSPLQSASPPTATPDFQSNEITSLANFLTSALQNMRNESIRKKAVINIQQSILQYATEDLQSQIDGTNRD